MKKRVKYTTKFGYLVLIEFGIVLDAGTFHYSESTKSDISDMCLL